jgi:4-hydroxy-4-methyl-2-oxoglutarate aldolase
VTDLRTRVAALTTAHLADGCIRVGVPVRCAPSDVRPALPAGQVFGRVRPARHVGSVDVFLEAFEIADEGDVLVVDNGGQSDHSCVGDLVALEAQAAGLAGIVIWGLHRDTVDLRVIGLPVFSQGAIPTGPLRVDPRPDDALARARVGAWTVGPNDLAVGDEDGVLFVPVDRAAEVVDAAEAIRDTERRQADLVRGGTSLRAQVDLAAFLARRTAEPGLTFRAHLRSVAGALEE